MGERERPGIGWTWTGRAPQVGQEGRWRLRRLVKQKGCEECESTARLDGRVGRPRARIRSPPGSPAVPIASSSALRAPQACVMPPLLHERQRFPETCLRLSAAHCPSLLSSSPLTRIHRSSPCSSDNDQPTPACLFGATRTPGRTAPYGRLALSGSL